MRKTTDAILRRGYAMAAIGHYGEKKQWGMVAEECAELIVAASHYARGRDGARDELIEELYGRNNRGRDNGG